jgi:hypothetical protein
MSRQNLRTSMHPGQFPPQAQAQSPALVARVEEKKAELRSLQELRDLSAAMAGQMEALEQRLGTLADGTQGRGGRFYFIFSFLFLFEDGASLGDCMSDYNGMTD